MAHRYKKLRTPSNKKIRIRLDLRSGFTRRGKESFLGNDVYATIVSVDVKEINQQRPESRIIL